MGAAAAATLLGMAFGVAGYTVGMESVEVRSPDDVTFVSTFGQSTTVRIPDFTKGKGGREIPDGATWHRDGIASGGGGAGGNSHVYPPSPATDPRNHEIQDLRRQLSEAEAREARAELGTVGYASSALPLARGEPGTAGGGSGGDTYTGTMADMDGIVSGSPRSINFGGGGGGGGHVYRGPAGEVPVLTDTPMVGYLFKGEKPADLPGFDRFTVGGGVSPQTIFLPKEGVVVDESKLDGLIDPEKRKQVRENFRQALDRGDLSLDVEWNRLIDESTTESSAPIIENPWIRPVGEAALSTFSVDVDTAGYSIVRRCLTRQNRLPPPAAVRIEELVNYFPWDYAPPSGADAFAVHVEAASCPWEPRHRLVRIALKGRVVEEAVRPAANLVFLLDVSGSMNQPNKLPLVKESLRLLAGRLDARDRVAMVVYAGASGLALPSTAGNDASTILHAIDNLSAGGSTNGGAGIELAYKVAAENFVPGGINRVVLATDGDFNVGTTSRADLATLIEEKAKSKVFLTALGYGMDNLKDDTLEQLADRGNGNYGYVDDLAEARRLLVDQGMSTLHAIAKDVKIQVEFNPAQVAGYRLLGYENRVLAAQDFADDRKDAGEIGAGHAVTAFYEVVPAGEPVPGSAVDELRYQRPGSWSGSLDTLTVKLRWKEPEGDESALREVPFTDGGGAFDGASEDFRFAAAVAEWGLLLRGSKNAGSASFAAVREIAAGAMGRDEGGWKAEFLLLVPLSEGMRK